MEIIEMKDGKMESVGEFQNATDLIREYCGDQLADFITGYFRENEKYVQEVGEYLEQKEADYKKEGEKYSSLEDVYEEHKREIEKFENQKVYEEFTEESVAEILAKYKELVEKINDILYRNIYKTY